MAENQAGQDAAQKPRDRAEATSGPQPWCVAGPFAALRGGDR